MAIHINKDQTLFHLQSEEMSYCIKIKNGIPQHAYWGKRLRDSEHLEQLLVETNPFKDQAPHEYPQYGVGDWRSPAYQVELMSTGDRVTELHYQDFEISPGKPKLEGLPAVYVEEESESDTLVLHLKDSYTHLHVYLSYTIFNHSNVISRSVRFENRGEDDLRLLKAMSMTVDYSSDQFEAMYLSGSWGREAVVNRRTLGPGILSIDSKRGASSPQLNPFLALVSPNADEETGEAFGYSLVYSGSFLAEVEVDQFKHARVSMGINPFDFRWPLAQGEHFQTPEVTMVYSSHGIGEMSRTYHKLYRTRLARGKYRDSERPVLINNWEGTYFDFTEDKLLSIAEVGKELGLELFVLDDGWFGKRDDDTTSLGDWTEDLAKLPNGLDGLAEKINDLGLAFGLWFEPEMISPKSELYRKHPDWCIHVKDRPRTEIRQQLTLDLTRQEVRDYLYEALSDIFKRVPLTYVKWDMNRHMTEIGSATLPADQQMTFTHRYMLGLYELLEKLTKAFPHILFENCSSGGGRFDPGMLAYMPQTWASDDSDAVERLKIQYGTSLVYPVSAIGAHVSASPNHQVGRVTDLKTRGDVAMSGNFGYELDLTTFTKEEKESVKEQVANYKAIRELVQQGDFYRLKNPFEQNETAWMFVSEDKAESMIFYAQVLAEPNPPKKTVKCQGLDLSKDYLVKETGEVYTAEYLTYVGLPVKLDNRDFQSNLYNLVVSHK